MNTSVIAATTIALGLGLAAPCQAEITSLRGNHAIDAPSQTPTKKALIKNKENIPRGFVSQPPVVPHKVDGYKINTGFNKCMSCHSWGNYRDADATKVSESHFEDRDYRVRADLAPRRYFCPLCHVSQMDTGPLVDNTFTPAPFSQ